MKSYFVSKCFETVTEESSMSGDCADHGFVFENVSMDIDEIKWEITQTGYSEVSSSYIPNNDEICMGWISTVYPEQTRNYFEKGEEIFYSLHINGISNREFIALCRVAGIQVETD